MCPVLGALVGEKAIEGVHEHPRDQLSGVVCAVEVGEDGEDAAVAVFAVGDVELGEDVADVGFDGAFADLLRNQIVAVVASLVWMLAADRLLIDALPAIGRWTPGGATFGLLQLGPTIATDGTLLEAPIGGLLLVGYTAAAAALALIVAPRRDVL